jgi:crossover junction endodeoxyribonuclease RuvC
MRLLGIDPGLRFSGYSIFQVQHGKTLLLDCGYLALPIKESVQVRVGLFYDFFLKKLSQWSIERIALETPFAGKNPQSFLKLGYLRGAIYVLAEQHTPPIVIQEFTPTQVKQAVTGFGGAQKDQVAHMIKRLFPQLELPSKLDVTDAIAVGLCGLWRNRQLQ